MTDKGMPEKIWAWGTSSKLEAQNNTRPNRSWWFDVGDLRKSDMPHCKEYIRKDLADELARALEYEQEKGRLSVSSATILARYNAATEGR